MGGAARGLHPLDLLEHLAVAPGEERAAVDHHVDLVGAGVDGEADVGQLARPSAPGRWGTAVATLAMWTPEPARAAAATGTMSG